MYRTDRCKGFDKLTAFGRAATGLYPFVRSSLIANMSRERLRKVSDQIISAELAELPQAE